MNGSCFFKRNCWLSTPVPGSLINTSQLRIQHFPCVFSVTCGVWCVVWMLTYLCCGKFLANTLPLPSSLRPLLTPLTGVFTLRGEISCLLSAVSPYVSLSSANRKNRYWHCSDCRQGRLAGYWLPGVKFRSGLPPSHPRLTIFLIGWHSSSLISTPVISLPLLRGRLRCAPGERLHEPLPWRYLIYWHY